LVADGVSVEPSRVLEQCEYEIKSVTDQFHVVLADIDRRWGRCGVRGRKSSRNPTFASAVAIAAASVLDQRPFEVVGVSPRAVAGDPSPGEHVLHEVPGRFIDRGLASPS